MKYIVFLLIIFSLISCKKEDLNEENSFVADPADFYQSQGNVLMMIITASGRFDYGYEFQLDSIVLNNNSIQLDLLTPNSDSVENYSGILQPYNDTLYSHASYFGGIRGDYIKADEFYRTSTTLPYHASNNQIFHWNSGDFNCELLWNSIADINVVKEYRNDSPNSKVGYLFKNTIDTVFIEDEIYYLDYNTKQCIILTR